MVLQDDSYAIYVTARRDHRRADHETQLVMGTMRKSTTTAAEINSVFCPLVADYYRRHWGGRPAYSRGFGLTPVMPG